LAAKLDPQETAESAAADASSVLRIYNTLSRRKEPFEPVRPGRVGIYLCGPTVYSKSHIGHMVGPVIFDAIKRYLTYCGYQTTFVVNITDVDDKIIAQAAKEGCSIQELSRRVEEDYRKHLASLHVEVDHFPRATEFIPQMQRMIERLIARGHAYPAGGDVYFDVTSFAEYGKLSNRRIEELTAGVRKEVNDAKRNPADFALWKGAKPGEPAWESPWGPGRPGWHIECSAMSSELLGETFDIHGGGLDLVFPHHEDEIAQSECSSGRPYARYWLHNGLMQYTNEARKIGAREGDYASQEQGKMSKSKGNVVGLDELFARFPPELVRYFLLSTHYRSPINFSDERLIEVGAGYERLRTFAELYERVVGESFYRAAAPRRRGEPAWTGEDSPLRGDVLKFRSRFLEYMDDDFNTGGAIAVVGELASRLNRFAAEAGLDEGRGGPSDVDAFRRGALVLKELTAILGIMLEEAPRASAGDEGLVGGLMNLLIQLRQEARQRKDFALADRIRDGLAGVGVVLQDGREGTRWKVDPGAAGRTS
jgi:cysteinyl-tRNA synthetase